MGTFGRRKATSALLVAAVVVAALVAGPMLSGGSPDAAAASRSGSVSRAPAAPSLVPSLQCPAGTGKGAPGVTRHEIKVGAISTLSGILAADFGSLVPGVKAYLDMVDAHGGVDGRKIVLAYDLDDAGLSSQFESDAHTVISQDHAFAVAISSYWFTPTYFTETCTPTYGYDVNGNWAGSPNLFAAYGSVLTLKTVAPSVAYLVKKTRSKSIAILAYGVSTSSDLCQTTGKLLTENGYKVSFTDLHVTPIDANLTPDVQRIEHAGSDFVVSCMTVSGNVSLARTLHEYGLHVHQLWFDGADSSVLKKFRDILQGVYFSVENVPTTAARVYPGVYPGLEKYLRAMARYAPGDAEDALALDGWESAALMVAGIRAASGHLTQAAVVTATNHMRAFTAGGLEAPVNWSISHTHVTAVSCTAFEKVEGARALPVFGHHRAVFLCFPNSSVRRPVPVAPPRGLPGPTRS